MPDKPINQVVADNLAYWMKEAEENQTTLAAKAGVSQKTISNYLNPDQRTEGAKGKLPSPKLTELDLIARALGIHVWQLTRQMTERERALYERIERAYQELIAAAPETNRKETAPDDSTHQQQPAEVYPPSADAEEIKRRIEQTSGISKVGARNESGKPGRLQGKGRNRNT